MYTHTTRAIKVTVIPTYLDSQSDTISRHYVWAYTIRLENLGNEVVQLLNRHWRITDANGQVQEVRGPGVIGEQPVMKPGDHYQYTSGTSLPTSSGIMAGEYEMEAAGGERFLVEIPAFSLVSPDQLNRAN